MSDSLKLFFEKAWEFLQKDIIPETFSSIYNNGIKAHGKKDYQKAIVLFERAYDINPKDFNCLYNLALSHEMSENYKDAIKFYNLALEINNKDYDTIYNIGLCYLNIKNGELAVEFLKQATIINDRDYDAKMNYILALIEDGQIDEGIKDAVNLVKYNKNYIDFTLSVAKAIEEKSSISETDGNIDKAIKLIENYLKINDKNSTAYLQLSACYSKKGVWSEALNWSLKAIELAPHSYETNANAGLVLFCNQSYERALKFYKTALSLEKKPSPTMHINIANTYEKLGQRDNAIKKIEYVLGHFKTLPSREGLEKYLKTLKNPDYKEEEEEFTPENKSTEENSEATTQNSEQTEEQANEEPKEEPNGSEES